MSAVAEIIKDRILYLLIVLGLGSGLIGAYGRERHEGRRPDANWWTSRLCIIPFLGIAASFAVDQFSLSNQQATFLSAVLAIMGYEAVRMILDRTKAKGEAMAKTASDIVGGTEPSAPRPYFSAVDTDDAGRPTAHVVAIDPDHPRRTAVGKSLEQSFKSGTVDDEGLAQLRSILGDDI